MTLDEPIGRVTLLVDSSALRHFAVINGRNPVAEMVDSAIEDAESLVGMSAVSLVEASKGLKEEQLLRLLALATQHAQVKLFPVDAGDALRAAHAAALYNCPAEVAHLLQLAAEHDDADVLTRRPDPYRGVLQEDMVFDLDSGWDDDEGWHLAQ